MIETNYHTIPTNLFPEIEAEASKLGVSVDYFLMEFCKVSDEE
jgi:hypothetical protein